MPVLLTDVHRKLARAFANAVAQQGGPSASEPYHIAKNIPFAEALYRGIFCQIAFALEFDIPLKDEVSEFGDGGVDFWLPLRTLKGVHVYQVDVKSKPVQRSREGLIRSGTHLRVPCNEIKAPVIYVNAFYHERTDDAEVSGWAWGYSLLERNEVDSFKKNSTGRPNYLMPYEELRDLQELKDRLVSGKAFARRRVK